MTPERFKQIKNILADTLDLPPEEQHAYLLERCQGDSLLLDEVQSLLATEMGQDFLNAPLSNLELDQDKIPSKIGRIKIHKLLAAGGMGKVYSGHDELLKRQVAVKVLHSNQQLSAEQRANFLHEAQALSSLQHPNICQIYDFLPNRVKTSWCLNTMMASP